MADAGKIAPTYEGEWSSSVAYDFHSYVTHNGNCYIARQTSTGVEPVDEENEYWFLALKNVSAEELSNLRKLIEELTNGTTSVGDSEKLGGKSADLYALLTDLANYIKNTGGEINGNVKVTSDEAVQREIGLENVLRELAFILNASGNFYLNDKTNGKTIFSLLANGTNSFFGTASGNLPLTGGMLESSTREMLKMNNTAGNGAGIGVYNKGVKIGEIKVSANGLSFTDANDNTYPVLHKGNKPTGTYTGNGGSQTINTGGIGEALLIRGNTGTSIVFGMGGMIGVRGGDLKSLGATLADYANGTLTLNTNDDMVNASGVTYTYQVL